MPYVDCPEAANTLSIGLIKAAYVTYFPDLAVPQAESDIRAFVELAKSLGLRHLVLLSGRGEEGAQKAEDVVKTSGLEWNIVRASWFMQNFSESFMLDGFLGVFETILLAEFS